MCGLNVRFYGVRWCGLAVASVVFILWTEKPVPRPYFLNTLGLCALLSNNCRTIPNAIRGRFRDWGLRALKTFTVFCFNGRLSKTVYLWDRHYESRCPSYRESTEIVKKGRDASFGCPFWQGARQKRIDCILKAFVQLICFFCV